MCPGIAILIELVTWVAIRLKSILVDATLLLIMLIGYKINVGKTDVASAYKEVHLMQHYSHWTVG